MVMQGLRRGNAPFVEANTVSSPNRPKISVKELVERRYITKMLLGMMAWGRAKLTGFPFDAQIEQSGDVYRVTVTVKHIPLPIIPEVIHEPKPEGSL